MSYRLNKYSLLFLYCELSSYGTAAEKFQVSARKELQSQNNGLPQGSGLSLLFLASSKITINHLLAMDTGAKCTALLSSSGDRSDVNKDVH